MALKIYKPTSPGQRGLILLDNSDLNHKKPYKKLLEKKSKQGGRNNNGRITTRHQGGGHKKRYRIIDFKRPFNESSSVVADIQYDPNRNARIALIEHKNGQKSYIICPQKLNVGDHVFSKEKADIKTGNCLLLKNIPVGTIIHNVELLPEKGAQLSRSAGTYAVVVGRESDTVQIRLSSGEVRILSSLCRATIGSVSNPDFKNTKLGKAGRSRWLGKRPSVRGVAMNPVDHPHGGGEGRTSGGRHPVTPWGVSTKGKKTRKNKRTSVFIVRNKK